jgi:hypothetical protein
LKGLVPVEVYAGGGNHLDFSLQKRGPGTFAVSMHSAVLISRTILTKKPAEKKIWFPARRYGWHWGKDWLRPSISKKTRAPCPRGITVLVDSDFQTGRIRFDGVMIPMKPGRTGFTSQRSAGTSCRLRRFIGCQPSLTGLTVSVTLPDGRSKVPVKSVRWNLT